MELPNDFDIAKTKLFIEKKGVSQIAREMNLTRQGTYNKLYSYFGEEIVKTQLYENSYQHYRMRPEEKQKILSEKEKKKNLKHKHMMDLSNLYNDPKKYTLDEIAEMMGYKGANSVSIRIARYREDGHEELFPKRNAESGYFRSEKS